MSGSYNYSLSLDLSESCSSKATPLDNVDSKADFIKQYDEIVVQQPYSDFHSNDAESSVEVFVEMERINSASFISRVT